MALLELAQFNESRIAVLLGVPPFLVGLPSGGDSMTYSNVDVAVRLPLAGRAAAEGRPGDGGPVGLARCRAGTTVEVNRDEYVQPGPLERAQTWQILDRHRRARPPSRSQQIERFTVAGQPTGDISAEVLT